MYSRGGTLTTLGTAHNRAMGRERESPTCLRSSPHPSLSFLEWSV